MIVAVKDHQRKSVGLVEALRSTGWFVVPLGAPADLLLIDYDLDRPAYRPVIEAYRARGSKIVIYPHSTLPPWHWDGLSKPFPVDAVLTIGTGQADVLSSFGYPYPVHPVGWAFCEQRPFAPSTTVERVLFAPIHPVGTGYLSPTFVAMNQEAYRTILGWDASVTVRHVGTLEMNGLAPEDGVRCEQGAMNTSLGSIDQHDLIVSARGTFASLAVARGKPTVMFQQVPAAHGAENPGEDETLTDHWQDYEQLMRYPYDMGNAAAPWRAIKTEASDWRERFIGPQLDPDRLSDLLTGIVREETSSGHPARTGSGDTRTRSQPAGNGDGRSVRRRSRV